MKAQLVEGLRGHFGVNDVRLSGVSGGCINDTFKCTVGNDDDVYFVKASDAKLDMFESEVIGLERMIAAECIKIPKPITRGVLSGGGRYLVLEWIEHGHVR